MGNETNTKVFSVRLVGARTNKGLSQQELADLLGVSLRSVQNWEEDSNKPIIPHGKSLRKISEILEVGVAYLLGEDKAQPLREQLSPYSEDSIQVKCHKYLSEVLSDYGDDEGQLWWVYHELLRRFPRKKPEKPTTSSTEPSELERIVKKVSGASGNDPED